MEIIARRDLGLEPATHKRVWPEGWVLHTTQPVVDPEEAWRGYQREALEVSLDDIPWNFGVTTEGEVYEGRGWQGRSTDGAHCLSIAHLCDRLTPASEAAIRELVLEGARRFPKIHYVKSADMPVVAAALDRELRGVSV